MIKVNLAGFADEAGNSLDEQISALKENNVFGLELRSIDSVNVAEFSIAQAKEY